MNERIRELAKQAGYKHPDAVGRCEDYAYFDHKKFAELIVQESIEVMKRHDYHGEWLGEKIREHFGVEE